MQRKEFIVSIASVTRELLETRGGAWAARARDARVRRTPSDGVVYEVAYDKRAV